MILKTGMSEFRKYLKSPHVTLLAQIKDNRFELFCLEGRSLRAAPAPADKILSTEAKDIESVMELLHKLMDSVKESDQAPVLALRAAKSC